MTRYFVGWGYRIWLEQTASYKVVAEAGQAGEALAVLQSAMSWLTSRRLVRDTIAEATVDSKLLQINLLADHPAGGGAALKVDLVILDLGWGRVLLTRSPVYSSASGN